MAKYFGIYIYIYFLQVPFTGPKTISDTIIAKNVGTLGCYIICLIIQEKGSQYNL